MRHGLAQVTRPGMCPAENILIPRIIFVYWKVFSTHFLCCHTRTKAQTEEMRISFSLLEEKESQQNMLGWLPIKIVLFFSGPVSCGAGYWPLGVTVPGEDSSSLCISWSPGNTGLWLDNKDHVACDWSIKITWPEYWLVIGSPNFASSAHPDPSGGLHGANHRRDSEVSRNMWLRQKGWRGKWSLCLPMSYYDIVIIMD